MIDPLRAALERLVELNETDWDTAGWDDAIAAGKSALAAAQPEGEPSDEELADPFAQCYLDSSALRGTSYLSGVRPAAPPAPAVGEVGELVAKLRRLSPQNPLGTADPTITRAATLLEQLAAPTPAVVPEGEVGELVAWLERQAAKWEIIDRKAGLTSSLVAGNFSRAAALLAQLSAAAPAVVPVAVIERPWERPGWCDAQGRCWAEHISRCGTASWRLARIDDLGGWSSRLLPAHALPLPAPQGEEGEG